MQRSSDPDVAGTEQHGKRNEANGDAPEYAGALFLNCGFKHDDGSSCVIDRFDCVSFGENSVRIGEAELQSAYDVRLASLRSAGTPKVQVTITP